MSSFCSGVIPDDKKQIGKYGRSAREKNFREFAFKRCLRPVSSSPFPRAFPFQLLSAVDGRDKTLASRVTMQRKQ